MTPLAQHLITLDTVTQLSDIPYISEGHSVGAISRIFGVDEIATWTVGPSLGGDGMLGCYDRWHVYDADGAYIGDLCDDAAGISYRDPIEGES